MTSSQHSRGRVLFETLCILGLGGSFAVAWLQTGVTAHLVSAAMAGLFGLSWSSGLFARRTAEFPVEETAGSIPVAAELAVAQEREVATEYAPPRIEIFAFEPDEVIEPPAAIEPKPVKEAKPKRRKKAAAAVLPEPVIDHPAEVAFEEPVHQETHIEQLFEPQPFVRQPRAFGRRARGLPPLPAA